MYRKVAILSSLLAAVRGQQVGTNQAETHPPMSIQRCTGSSCQTQQGSVVLDSNWRWTHITNGFTNCYTGNEWDDTVCSSPSTCAQNCAIDGADYPGTYGITSSGNALTLKFVTNGPFSTNVGSRVYLMETDTRYRMFRLLNQEFTFDVDVSQLPCGLNGALYFIEMDADGGMARFPNNRAGARFGTGYCDAQCPHDIKFINGEANILDWDGSPTDPNAGSGRYGTCCDEMDIWESNSEATAYTPHTCSSTGQTRCSGTQCGDNPDNRYGGICDKDGCDFNSFRMGDQTFYGDGLTVDSSQKMTVVTQFITNNGNANGQLTEIRRLYVQNGQVIQNSVSNLPGVPEHSSLTDANCQAAKSVFGDTNDFAAKGGMRKMGTALGRGVVLAMSIWADHAAHMLWLDSSYPLDRPESDPGIKRGNCPTDSGDPDDMTANHPDAQVIYSNIRYGDLDSTY